jgi:ATP-dependent Clp protease protease subunit
MSTWNVSLDENNRRIYMAGEINESMTHAMMIALHKLDKTEGDITIIMNSEGGSEPSGYALFDCITMCKNMVIIEGYGEISSISAAIFQAPDIRRMAPNARIMIHNGTIPVGEEAQQNLVIDLADQIKKANQRYHSILSSRSRLSYADIEEACERDTYFTAEEALSDGLCDEILVPHKTFNKTKKGRKKK